MKWFCSMPDLNNLAREVHLWFLPTERFEDAELAEMSADILSAEEQSRAERFAFAKDRRSYILAHWLMRTVLSEYARVPPASWEFTRTLLGKPAVQAPPANIHLEINLSHTVGMVACAVTAAGEVGVDVETVTPRDHLKLARRFFAPEEVSQMEQLPADRRDQAFFRFWTQKEAYIKARGLGLSLDLASFWFPDVMGETIDIAFAADMDDRPGDWQFYRHEPDEQHKIAVAVHRPHRPKAALKIFANVVPGEAREGFL